MKGKKSLHLVSLALCTTLAASSLALFASCGENGYQKDAIVLMTEPLSGLYNPFYATTGADMGVVGLTQMSMLSTDDQGLPVAGDDRDTVVKAFDTGVYDPAKDETVYTFVLKNGIKYSDGVPLTMNDVFFNIYEYLDPVYTGSSTMYSIKIKGLSQYRTQSNTSGGGDSEQEAISKSAASYARERIRALRTLYTTKGLVKGTTGSYRRSEAEMRADINEWKPSTGYKTAVATTAQRATYTDADYRKQLAADYDLTLETFRKELESDYIAAQESFDTDNAPYNEYKDKLSNEVFRFFLFEGNITPVYADDPVNKGKKDKLKIEKFDGEDILNRYSTKEAAIDKVFNDNVTTGLHQVLSAWGTAGTLSTIYTADAIDVILHNVNGTDGGLVYKNIEGVVSLGHTTDVASVRIDGTDYKVAHEHNADGTPKNADEYDVLQITVEKQDPKAIYSFGFSVAPVHYYTADADHPNGRTVDIKNNQFGVEFANAEFQSKVIQSLEHVEVPVGAGAFMATDVNGSDMPSGSGFVSSNIVYYKANPNFIFPVKAAKLQMQVISSNNALDKLANGEVDYITPQYTKANSERLKSMQNDGFKQLSAWQLGYGYVGINAGKVPNIYIRRAIMAAMQAYKATEYYEVNTCKVNPWPMSTQSWAYPWDDSSKQNAKSNDHDYINWTTVASAEEKITGYMREAGVSAGDSQLKIKFTIAGASITEHPTYPVFKQAAEILNKLGWDVEVKADSQALTKLSTGSLEVWAAAWGSSVDPDMYQVYHKNSTATSVYAWGYREIKEDPARYVEETRIINSLSATIDEARSITDRGERTALYEQAMRYVLDLAVEMPIYQRQTLYAYNTKTIKGLSDKVNPYSSPLEKIWELELA